MDDLITRLRAALDQAQHQAQAAFEGNGWMRWPLTGEWRAGSGGYVEDVSGQPIVFAEGGHDEHQAAHIAAWCPARVLRLIASHRQLLEEFEEAERYYTANVSAPAGELHGLRTAVTGAAAFWLGEDTE